MTLLRLEKIRTDGGTQPRAAIDFDAVGDYMDAMRDGVKFPPLDVFYDGTEYWLADGFHRLKAAFGAEFEEIACNVHQGTQADAQWFSFAANKANGLRRTNEDKQRAVKSALSHPKSAAMSNNAISKHVGVSHTLVDEWRRRLSPALADSASETSSSRNVSNASRRECSDGRVMNVTNIGKARKSVPVQEPDPAIEEYVADEPEYAEPVVEVDRAPVAQLEAPPICDRKVAGSTPAGGSIRTAPSKPEPVVDKQALAVALLRALFDLAEHRMSASELVAMTPQSNIAELASKARGAFEFAGFVFDAAFKRQKEIA